jgi:N-acetylglucosamine malate deacetylase 2
MAYPSNSGAPHEHGLTGERLALLAVFAHAEDEAFGPAGTLAKYASEGIDVSLVTATRNNSVEMESAELPARDRACSCRASGIRRACLFDRREELRRVDPANIAERLVRLIREIRPQVMITFGPGGLTGDADQRVVNDAALAAFHAAGDASKFGHHLGDGLQTWSPQKLYYCLLPHSIVQRWGVPGLNSVPDDQITSRLDVSMHSQAMKNALYCQRHGALDFIRGLMENPQVEWTTEYYALIESRLRKKPRHEKDLFAGLR